jgi:hypothetical protein
MGPNIFIPYAHSGEDCFSHSLAYILNILPPLGDSVLRRIATLAGKVPGYFGRFQTCEFVAHELPYTHAASKPDLKLVCSKSTVYFENKLNAPLSVAQMRRHGELVGRTPKSYLVFVSNINHRSPVLHTIRGYVHPTGRDHYLWVDLLPAFAGAYRKSSLAARLLDDFRTALKLQGMIGRRIKGAAGSLYTIGSEACHLALRQLWDQLQTMGFTLDRKRPHESTLRVYASREREYPLLNPRFEPTATGLKHDLDFECLVFTALSRSNGSLISRHLARFPSQRDCVFVPDRFQKSDYNYHGHLVLPVEFIPQGATSSIDFCTLEKPLTRILAFLGNA